MSNMPICGHLPSLAPASGVRPSAFICVGQGLELVPRGRDGVALLLEEALPVVDGPRVEVEGHEVLLAVEARRGALEAVGEAVEVAPHIGDVADDALLRERPHPVPGEPAHDVVGLLDVGVEVLLVRVVVDGVDLDVETRGRDRRGDRLAVLRVGVVRPEGDRADVARRRRGGGGRRGRGSGASWCRSVRRWQRRLIVVIAAGAEHGAPPSERGTADQQVAAPDRETDLGRAR